MNLGPTNGVSYHDYIKKITHNNVNKCIINKPIKNYDEETTNSKMIRVKSAPQLTSKMNYFEYIQQLRTCQSDSNLSDMDKKN